MFYKVIRTIVSLWLFQLLLCGMFLFMPLQTWSLTNGLNCRLYKSVNIWNGIPFVGLFDIFTWQNFNYYFYSKNMSGHIQTDLVEDLNIDGLKLNFSSKSVLDTSGNVIVELREIK